VEAEADRTVGRTGEEIIFVWVGSWRETCNSWGSIFVLIVLASTGCSINDFVSNDSVSFSFVSNGPTSCVIEYASLYGTLASSNEGVSCFPWLVEAEVLRLFSGDSFSSRESLFFSIGALTDELSIVFSFDPNKSIFFANESPSVDANDSRVFMSFSDNVFDSNGSVLFPKAKSKDDPNEDVECFPWTAEVWMFGSLYAFKTAAEFSDDSLCKPLVAAETPASNFSRRIFEDVICWSTLATSSFESSQSTLLKISLTFANASTGRPSFSSTRGRSIEITEDEASISEKRTFNQKYNI